MDIYFSRRFIFSDQLETLESAQACLFIAMKYEEIYPPELCEWVEPRRVSAIIKKEAEILG